MFFDEPDDPEFEEEHEEPMDVIFELICTVVFIGIGLFVVAVILSHFKI